MCIQDGTYCSTSVAKQRKGVDQFKDYFTLYGRQGDEWTDPGLVISHLCYCYHAIHYSVAAYCSQFSTFLCDSPTVCDNGWLITIVLRQTLSNAWGTGPTWHARCCENGTASVVRQPASAWSTGPNTVGFKTIVFRKRTNKKTVQFGVYIFSYIFTYTHENVTDLAEHIPDYTVSQPTAQ